jgi:ATP-dependent Lhr-like helicase
MRFLFEWQHVATGAQVSGPDALAAVLAQLEGFEVAAAAWESDVLPARVAGYEISWLDDLCMAGRIAWSRLRNSGRRPSTDVPLPPRGRGGGDSRSERQGEGDRSTDSAQADEGAAAAVARMPASREAGGGANGRASGPVRATPIVLLQRRNMATWTTLAGTTQTPPLLSSRAEAIADELRNHGASFFDELVASAHLLQTEVEDSLSELVAAGMVTSDSYAGLRALLLPPSRRPSTSRRRGRRTALFGIADAGRWSLVRRSSIQPSALSPGPTRADRHGHDPELVEFVVRTLLKRYGVISWRLLAREAQWLPPWRELLRVCHRLEARGEIRGGRFIAGLTGEQFALPEAIGLLRSIRQKAHDGSLVAVSGADPLNLSGYLVVGPRVPSLAGARVLYRDGAPIATLIAGEFTTLEPLDEAAAWAAKTRLLRVHGEYAVAGAEES